MFRIANCHRLGSRLGWDGHDRSFREGLGLNEDGVDNYSSRIVGDQYNELAASNVDHFFSTTWITIAGHL